MSQPNLRTVVHFQEVEKDSKRFINVFSTGIILDYSFVSSFGTMRAKIKTLLRQIHE